MRIITHIFFTLGLFFATTFIHEFIHHLDCGGDFIAGFYYIEGKAWAGVTYCKDKDGEFWPSVIAGVFMLSIAVPYLLDWWKIDRK